MAAGHLHCSEAEVTVIGGSGDFEGVADFTDADGLV